MRKKIEINWEVVDQLLEKQCTEREIASALKICPDTLLRGCKRERKMTFEQYAHEKRPAGQASLRSLLWRLAMAGDSKVAIHLSKHYLGMVDKIEQKIDSNQPVIFEIIGLDSIDEA
jgi:IS30 family transposase